MKRVIGFIAAVLMMGTVWGCGDSDDSSNSTTAQDNETVSEPSGAPPTVVVAAATPKEAVTSFLEALCQGTEDEAAALLTTTAREETIRHEKVVQPPGAPNAKYVVGRVEIPDGGDLAYVSCIWSEKFQNGVEESYEVVWILRQETAGWRIAGMATQLAEDGPPVVLNFEDLADMEAKILQAEIAAQQSSGSDDTRQAAQPSSDTIKR